MQGVFWILRACNKGRSLRGLAQQGLQVELLCQVVAAEEAYPRGNSCGTQESRRFIKGADEEADQREPPKAGERPSLPRVTASHSAWVDSLVARGALDDYPAL